MDQAIVFFDGICGLCNGFVRLILKIDEKKFFKFAPLQEFQGELPASLQSSMKSVVVKTAEGRFLIKSEAVIYILQNTGRAGFILGCILWLVPRPLRDFAYDGVARYRYRIFGQRSYCAAMQPAEQERFLRKSSSSS